MVMKINLEVSAIVTENDNQYIIPTSQTGWSYIKSMEVKYMDYYEILGSSLFKKTSKFISSISGYNSSNVLDGYIQQYLWWASKDSLIWEKSIEKVLPYIVDIKTTNIRELSLSLLKPIGLSSRANMLNKLIAKDIVAEKSIDPIDLDIEEVFINIGQAHVKSQSKNVVVFASTLTDIDYYGSFYKKQGYEVIFVSLVSLPAWLSEYSTRYGKIIQFDDNKIYNCFEAAYPMHLAIENTYEYNQRYCLKFLEYLKELNMSELFFNQIGNISKIALPDHPIIILYPFLEYAYINNISIDIIPHNKTNYGFAWSNKRTNKSINLFCPVNNKYNYKSLHNIIPTNQFQYLRRETKQNITEFAVIFAPALIAPRYNTHFSPLLLLKRIYSATLRYMQYNNSSNLIYYKPKNYYPHELDFQEMVTLCRHLLSNEEAELLNTIIPFKHNINSDKIMQYKVDGIFIRDGSMIDVCLMNGNRAFHMVDDTKNWQLSENICRDKVFRLHPDYHIL